MRTVAAVSRFWILFTWSLVSSLQAPMLRPIVAWGEHWAANRSSILMLAAVNTTIAASTEAGARSLWPMITGQNEHGFLVREQHETRVNGQSLISILMTLFASLIGGPVYFLRKRTHRFLFFAGFGLFNSVLSQSLVSLARDGLVILLAQRLWFDLAYNGTFKFILFETTRHSILRRRRCVFSVTTIRATQDFLTTCFRVAMLNWIGLKG